MPGSELNVVDIHTKVYCIKTSSRTLELRYEINMGLLNYSFSYSFSKYIMSIYSVPGRVLTSEPPGGDAIKLGKMIVRGCFSYGSGSRLRVGEDLEFTATNYLMIIKQTPKLIRSHVLGLTGVTD